MGTPARGWSRPPFAEGNLAAVKHGALSPRLIEPRAAEMAAALLELASVEGSPVAYLQDRSYAWAVAAWAKCEAAIERLDVFLTTFGEHDDERRERPAVRRLDRLETRALTLRARLGLDPLARARLGRDIAAGSVDLARLLSAHDDEGAIDGQS